MLPKSEPPAHHHGGSSARGSSLSATLALALWNALNAIVTALVVFGALWGAGYLAWKQDPNMLAILKASTRFKARYDPGKWIAEPWRVILKGRYE